MPRMGDLGRILEQVVDGLDDGPLAEHLLLPQGQQPVLHVPAHARDQPDALRPEALGEPREDVPPIGEHVPPEPAREQGPDPGVQVARVGPGEREADDLPPVVAEQVELEAVRPPHRIPPVRGRPGEDPVAVAPSVVADGDHGGVGVGDARARPQGPGAQESGERDEDPRQQLEEPVVGDRRGEESVLLPPDEVQVVLLEIPVGAEVEQQRDGDDLALGERGGPAAAPGARRGQLRPSYAHPHEFLAAIVHVTENFYNFVVGNHNGCFF